MKKKIAIYLAACALPVHVTAQELWQEDDVDPGKLNLCEGVEYGLEMQGSLSKGKTPLWLNANKYGLSSLDERNGYMRVNVTRPLAADSALRWAVGYGGDVVAPVIKWQPDAGRQCAPCSSGSPCLAGLLDLADIQWLGKDERSHRVWYDD